MIIKYYYIILFYSLLFFYNTNAQNIDAYKQIDTIKISDSLKSKIFIIKADTAEIISKDISNYLITQIEITDFNDNSIVQTIIDTSAMNFGVGEIDFVDVNFDGYLDIDINLGFHDLTPFHSFWLYDNSKNIFYYSPEFSQLNDYSFDSDKKEIKSNSQSTGGRGGYSEILNVENGKLSLIETEYSNYNDYERKRLIKNVLRTDSLVETGSLNDGTSVFEIYNLVNDSLLLTEKSWLVDLEMPFPKDVYMNEIYNCGIWGGCMKYLRKEIYIYDDKQQIFSIQDTLKYQAVDNKWKKVKTFVK
jgi:hypothetical protein